MAGPAAAQAPTWQWGLQTTNPTPTDQTDAVGYEVVTDAAGRVYVGGAFGDDAGNPPLATRSLGSVATLGPGAGGFVAQATAAGQWAWATALQPTGPNSLGHAEVKVMGLAVAPAGDLYAIGLVGGTGLSGGGQTATLGTAPDGLFVARLTSAGAVMWLRVVGGKFFAPTVAADPSTGGVVVADRYNDAPVFGAIALPARTRADGNAPFVARLSAAGTWTAAVAVTGTGGTNDRMHLAVGPAGQVAVGGAQEPGTLTLGSFSRTVPAGAYGRFFVAQLSPGNQWQWLTGSAGGNESNAFQAAYTAAGALWVSGEGDAGTTVGALTLAPVSGGPAGFVGQLSASGQWTTAQTLTTTTAGFAAFGPLAVDAAGNALALGVIGAPTTSVQAQLGSQLLVAPAGDNLLFVAGLNSAGQWRYVASVPAVAAGASLMPAAIALDNVGSLYFTGSLQGGLTLGSSVLLGSTDNGAPFPAGSDAVLGKLANATALAARAAAPAAALALYPRPAHGMATLRRPAPAADALLIGIVDALGRTVQTQAFPAAALEAPLDLTGLTPGLYLVRVGAATARLVVE